MKLALGLLSSLLLATEAHAAPSTPAPPRRALVVQVDGLLGPVLGQFMIRNIRSARVHGDTMVILRLDTPGGLDTTMRSVIKEILASSVPVITYVSPAGQPCSRNGTGDQPRGGDSRAAPEPGEF
jgi:membrane-bound serine protease (ClpP class)